METVTLNRFDEGAAESIYSEALGQFSISKHFDTFTYPYRLKPYRGVNADTTGQTLVGNLTVGADNLIYGLGIDPNNPTDQQIYRKTNPTAGAWVGLTNSKTGAAVNYDLFVEYHGAFYTADHGNHIFSADRSDVADIKNHSLIFNQIAQGLVHPKDDILYIPHDYIIASNNNGTWTDAALTLPSNLRITSLAWYGDYLAIATTPHLNGLDCPSRSVVYLWDRDATLNTLSEVIDWGTGNLLVLANHDGVLIGISDVGFSTDIMDMDSIQIKAYDGTTPQLIRELPTNKQTTTTPDAIINPRVNFLHRGRLFFSISLNGGSTSPTYNGLWSLGKSKLTGRYCVTIERVATNDNSETGVIAAAIGGDLCSLVHTSEGTLTFSSTASDSASAYSATSVYETLANPQMPAADRPLRKKLYALAATFLPLTSSGQIICKYRIDGGDWLTVFTATNANATDNGTAYEATIDANGDQFIDGRNFEFHLESTGGAEITALIYRYDKVKTAISV